MWAQRPPSSGECGSPPYRCLMMHTMDGYPKYRTTFQSQGAANCQNVLDPLWCFVSAMGKEAMVAHTYSYTTCDPPQKHPQ